MRKGNSHCVSQVESEVGRMKERREEGRKEKEKRLQLFPQAIPKVARPRSP